MAKTPATRDWSQLRTDILNAVGLPGSTNAQARALAAQRRAVDMLNTHRWRMLLSYQDITLVAGTSEYDATAEFRAARQLLRLDSNGKAQGRISYMGFEEFDETYFDRSTSGTPCHYTVRNTAANYVIELSAPPDASFVSSYPTLRLRLFPAVQPLVGASDNFGADQGVTAEMEFFVELYARYLLCLDYRPQRAQEWKREAEEAFARLKTADNKFDFMDWE